MASGWNLWVWLQCIGVASRCCCKEVYKYPHNTVISLFFVVEIFSDSTLVRKFVT